MFGMDRTTGKALGGIAHINQSVDDILSTRLDTRFIRRPYGSQLRDLIDAPMHDGTVADFVFAVADALARHEDRIILKTVAFVMNAEGRLVITPEVELTETGRVVVLGNVSLDSAS